MDGLNVQVATLAYRILH